MKNKYSETEVGEKTLHKIKYLVLWVTGRCNLQCKYCYAEAGISLGDMDFDRAVRALAIPEGNYKLQIAGGEPLLNWSLIKELHVYLKNHNPQIKMQIQTNGTLITEEIASDMKKMGMAIGVSLDGKPALNNLQRGESANVINGIKLLGNAGVMANINCVVTSLNILNLDSLVDMVFYLGNVPGIGLDLLRKSGRGKSGIEIANTIAIEKGLIKAYNRTKELYRLTGRQIIIREIENARHALKKKNGCSEYCYAAEGSSGVLLPNGDIYPCGSLVGDKKYYMGNIDSPETWRLHSLQSARPAICNECRFNDFCAGACPSRSILNGEKSVFSYEDCTLRKTAFEIVEKEMV